MDSAPSGVARFLTVADAAQLFSVGVDEIHDLIDSAELPALRLGETWRIDRAELDAFVERRYEEQRRIALLHGSDIAGIADFAS
jgi:excisionase family DNA binding protein